MLMAMSPRMVETGKITWSNFRGQKKEVAVLKASETVVPDHRCSLISVGYAPPCIMSTPRKDSHTDPPRR